MEIAGTGKSSFLVHREEALQRSVLNGLVVQDGQSGSHANAVVGTQGGAITYQPTVLNKGFDALGVEVELLVAILLTHHVHVCLQADTGGIFIALVGGFANEHIAHLVGEGLIAVLLTEILQICRNLLFMFRRSGNVHQFAKVLPHFGRLQIF